MKIFAFLLSLFFVLLVTIPCNDAASLSSESSVSIQEKTNSAGHSDNDPCSAFCSCACCGIVMDLEKIDLEIKDKKAIIHIAKISDFQHSQPLKRPSVVWQPPKLS